MKVAVIGSRSFNDYMLLSEELKKYEISCIISGGAKGADQLAERYALKHNIPTVIFEAKWNDLSHPNAVIKKNSWGKEYDAMAGKRRNKDIVNAADCIIAFWDGRSPGTQDSIDFAKKLEKPLIVIPF